MRMPLRFLLLFFLIPLLATASWPQTEPCAFGEAVRCGEGGVEVSNMFRESGPTPSSLVFCF